MSDSASDGTPGPITPPRGRSAGGPDGARRPNILLIMADQLPAPMLGLHGGAALTPHVDRLAAEGTTFSSAHSDSPLCAPARSVMMTGRRAARIGAHDNASELASSIPTFAHHLRAAGYRTCLVGKMHFVGADQLHGFEQRLTTDIYPADFGWTPRWDRPDERAERWFHDMGSVVHAGVVDVSNQLDFDDEVGFRAVRHLRDLARDDDDSPWMVTVSFTHPHDPYVARREHWDRYDHDAVPMPRVGPLPEGELDPHSRRLRHLMAADVTSVTDEQVRSARHAHLANTSYVDDHVGRLVSVLAHHSMLDDTVVVVTSDHGDMLGERGLWYKMSFFEHACRIPLVVRVPGGRGGVVNPTHVSLLDVAPTLLELAGVEPDPSHDAPGVVDLLGSGRDADRTVLGEYLGEGAIAPILMIRRGALKFVWSRPDGAQLFDLDEDPDELVDLAGDPARAPTVDELIAEVHERWDPDALEADVRRGQLERSLVDRALRRGRPTPWDHEPRVDASEQYMRNHLDLNEVEAARRA